MDLTGKSSRTCSAQNYTGGREGDWGGGAVLSITLKAQDFAHALI